MATSGRDFAVLPVKMPVLESYPVETIHYLYLRPNTPKIPTPDDPRSVFVTNVPADSSFDHFRALIASLIGNGRFENITFENDLSPYKVSHEPAQAQKLFLMHKKRKRSDEEASETVPVGSFPKTWTRTLYRSGSSAVILLADEHSVKSLLKAIKKFGKSENHPTWGGKAVDDKTPPLGSQWLKWHNQLSYPGNDVVQSATEAYFEEFNRKEEEAVRLAKRIRNEPDEDGFVTVTSGGRRAPASQAEAEEAKQRMIDREQKKKEDTTDFYRFQQREKRKAEQNKRLEQFEEDKKKVRAMRERKANFRPET
ncbi:ribosomal RNA-processing protein 7-domain-containing protein [Xylariaceae sp. FL0016]|nr:ribosomal RNA-processing protein 7-domain-containing protein [Xylariaceae sp. FL0016]